MNKVNAELGDQNIARDEGGEKAEPSASLDAAIAKPPIHKQTSLAETLNVAHPEDGHADEQADHRPVVLGHRGTIYEEPENTVQGFAKAADLGCDGFELDAFLLRCGTLVCFHGGGGDMDPGDLWDYCGVKGNIMDYTAEEARKLSLDHERKAFENFPRFKMKHATIPTLEEVLGLVKDESTDAGTPIVVKIELKGPGTPDPAVELVERLGMQDQCYFSSFYHDRIARVRELRPQKHPDGTHVFKTGALFRVPPENFVKICQDLDATEVHLRYDTCSKERVDAIHDAGMDSLAWFRGPVAMEKDTRKFSDVGNEDHIMYQTVLNSGVESMVVNRPDVLLELVDDSERKAAT